MVHSVQTAISVQVLEEMEAKVAIFLEFILPLSTLLFFSSFFMLSKCIWKKSLHYHPDNQHQEYSKSSPSSSSSCLECPKSCVTKLMVSLLPTPRTSYRSLWTHITIILFIINVFVLITIFILRTIVNFNRAIIIICVNIVILE